MRKLGSLSGMLMKGAIAALAVTMLLSAGTAHAILVTSLPTGTVIPMPAVELFTAGPQTMAPGIVWTSTNATIQGGSVFGYTGDYSFGDNGFWSGNPPMAGLNDAFDLYGVVDTMTFTFSTPVTGVGGHLNWTNYDSPAIMAVYDASNNLLESFTLAAGGVNLVPPDAFYGFVASSPIISSFRLTDEYIGLRDLTIQGPAAVPEPGTWLLLASGLVGLLGYGWRRQQRAA
jgi:PEP-CTERM motif